METELILKQLKKGDNEAYHKIFDMYYYQLVIFAVKMVKDIDLARDLVQDVIVHFYEKREEINIHTSLKAHFYQSVKNKCLNHLNREKLIKNHHSGIYLSTKNSEISDIDFMEVSELQQKIDDIVDNLPEGCKKIFIQSRYKGLSNSEIAELYDISKRTVETQISNALKRLRANLKSYIHILIGFIITFF